MSSRAQQNTKLTKLFTKCSTNPAVKCLIIEDQEIQDDIRDHLPGRSDTLECLKLSSGLIQSTDMLEEVLKPLINLQQLVISDQNSLHDMPQSSRISKENYLKCSLQSQAMSRGRLSFSSVGRIAEYGLTIYFGLYYCSHLPKKKPRVSSYTPAHTIR